MTQKIIFPNGAGGIAVLHPTGELPIDEVARKDVPAGLPFLIVNEADIPADRTFRPAWDADFSTPHGTGIGAEDWFIEQYGAELASAEAEPEPAPPVAVEPLAFEDYPFPAEEEDVEIDEDARATAYAAYCAEVKAGNRQREREHEKALARWRADKAAELAVLRGRIATMEQQKAAIEAGEAQP